MGETSKSNAIYALFLTRGQDYSRY